MRGYCWVLLAVIVAVSEVTFAQKTVLVSAVNYPPYHNANAELGGRRGVVVDLVTETFNTLDMEMALLFVPMARAEWSLIERRHQAMLGTLPWFSADKRSRVTPVDLVSINFVFFYRKDVFPEGISFSQLDELKPYRIGNVRGSSTTAVLAEHQLNQELISDIEQNFKRLNAGLIDLVVSVDLSGWTILKKLYPERFKDFGMSDSFYSSSASIMFLTENAELIEQFKTGLERIINNGRYDEIVDSYYGEFLGKGSQKRSLSADIVP